MDGDLGQKLDQLLNSPDGMAKITQMMAALGVSPDTQSDAPTVPAAPPPPPPSPPTEGLPDLSGLLQLAPLLTSMGQDDQNTALLKALRPYLHGGREKRLDESVKLMQLLKFLPLLQERGLFK